MLKVADQLPDGLLARDATRLHEVLGGPTLLHLPGRRTPALFVSVLLHGNEDTGWEAVRALLDKYHDRPLPRALSLFIGNVQAARYRRRQLDGQQDYNRVWRGGDSPEHHMMAAVLEQMRSRGVFASIDIHNNTGLNPHYGCVNRLEPRYLQLARLFSRTVVYFVQPDSVQSMAFSELCPAVTVECGQPGQPLSVSHALEYLEAALHLSDWPEHALQAQDVDLFHTVAVVKVPPESSFSFEREDTDIRLAADLDRMNFHETPVGTVLGWTRGDRHPVLDVRDESGAQVGEHFFEVRDGAIVTLRPVMPSMLTLDAEVIRQDCLCYLMERYPYPTEQPNAELTGP